MPDFEVSTAQRQQAQHMVRFVVDAFALLDDSGKKVFLIELLREIGPEVQAILASLKNRP